MKIQVITATNGWFIKDAANDGRYGYNSKMPAFLFDGKHPESTFHPGWYRIEPEVSQVQEIIPPKTINERYELNRPDLQSTRYPLVIDRARYRELTNECSDDFDSIVEAIYDYKCDKTEATVVDADVEFEYLLRFDKDILKPEGTFAAGKYWSEINREWRDASISVSNAQHQLIDKIMFPDLILHECPCSFTSEQMYKITRDFIKANIDLSVAEISSDYDFCFEVQKKIRKTIPEVQTYYNLFARTKKQREKPQIRNVNFTKYTIFEMTYSPKKYDRYTPIPAMYANNAAELKEKVDAWLQYIISIINEPLCECPQCLGKGYLVPDKIGLNYDSVEKENTECI